MVTEKHCLLNKSFYSSDAQAVKVVNTSARSEHDFEHFSPEMDRPTYVMHEVLSNDSTRGYQLLPSKM